MIICDRCPLLIKSDRGLFMRCAISGNGILYVNKYVTSETYCPIKQIELKDGTTFKPEIYDGKN